MAKAKKAGTGRGRRKSKAESMTGAKENAVEMRTIGDNSGLDLGEPVIIESSDFAYHLKAIKAAMEKKDTAVQLLNGCYKNAKKINKDLPDAIRKVITVERANDPAAFRAQLEVLGIALRETGSPIQLTVFDTLAGDVADQARKRGFADGEAGRPASNKYPENSDLSQQYIDGFIEGQAKKLGVTQEQLAVATDQASEDEVETDTEAERELEDA